MDFIRHHKRQARLRAATNGTSHQAELNAIARKAGYTSWGEFAHKLSNDTPPMAMPPLPTPMPRTSLEDILASMTPEERAHDAEMERRRYDMLPIEDPEGELAALIDGYEAARRVGGHLVVLRRTPAREEKIIELLWIHHAEGAHDPRLDGLAFTPFLDHGGVAIENAVSHGHTLVTGSGDLSRDVQEGLFIVHDARQRLTQINRLYSKSDQAIIDAVTSVKIPLPQDDAVGRTTIRRAQMKAGRIAR